MPESDQVLGPHYAGDSAADVPAALSSARAIVLAHLSAASPLTVKQLAESTNQHVSTVRAHLDALVEAGLATKEERRPDGRGRPALAYSAVQATPAKTTLASTVLTLSRALRSTPRGASAAVRAGVQWGRSLRETYAALDPADRVTASMSDAGFSPLRSEPGTWHLTRCPLLEAARENPEVVCGVHQGLLVGLLHGTGLGDRVELRPFAVPGACLVSIPAFSAPV